MEVEVLLLEGSVLSVEAELFLEKHITYIRETLQLGLQV